MANQENIIEAIINQLNEHFNMEIEAGEEGFPYIISANIKDTSSIEDFLNNLLAVIESSDTKGKLMYYFDNELDFDTPEEYHRH